VLTEMEPGEVCREIKEAGLRGRGGGGFNAGLKWELALKQTAERKYVICNGDEGDPGAFMDRSIMEGDPHKVIEGLMIAGYATGASTGYIYVRAEYPLAVRRLKKALKDAEEAGLLGEDILAAGFSFKIKIKEGAGAFVCGEETALMASIEGQRGMPRPKPPFPAEHGLWGYPTTINNVETLANVPLIIGEGFSWFRQMGTANSPGTKTFAITGDVANTGLIEVPMGLTLREVVYDIGGGIKDGKEFKAVQIGGPSGGWLTEEHLDLPLDYDSLKEAGAMIGSGGLVVMDEETCTVEIARYFMEFTQNESCGKCVLCREGTKRMLELLEKIVGGKAGQADITALEEIARAVKDGSLCGLGKTAPNPVLATLHYFRDEYQAHVNDKVCPAGVCKALVQLKIEPELCKGCTKCARVCPAGAISGQVKETHTIDSTVCIKCGVCIEACPFGAIKEG
ncbi:MAG: NADH-ubiquinone oxidoreductase-F iron-sulfur binding region domain-containing protein, partial [Halanaerobium sp.]|nr:NADH-ubiquinone oxidoreductase-F iron-sulfur binding region domain-containing protein [Halanaerobium sp.]